MNVSKTKEILKVDSLVRLLDFIIMNMITIRIAFRQRNKRATIQINTKVKNKQVYHNNNKTASRLKILSSLTSVRGKINLAFSKKNLSLNEPTIDQAYSTVMNLSSRSRQIIRLPYLMIQILSKNQMNLRSTTRITIQIVKFTNNISFFPGIRIYILCSQQVGQVPS